MSINEVFIGFGSNLGDRCALINKALSALAVLPATFLVKLSSLYETAPVGYLEQGAFLNGVIQVRSGLSAPALLERLLAIENTLGRVRKERWGPRTIDLDILFYGAAVISSPDLLVPHPELVRRRFVLEPLCEIAPAWRHPQLTVTIAELLHQYQLNNPDEIPCRIVAGALPVVSHEVTDGIFYRYGQSC
ncbi:MAG: 2-amino-4-hydroxy-6-hydroxymethyldihydropteridine diphosphokinase [Deltaproteobacteria bacterium]|nr:2-amino-4-hydroxy-6-hydroxymethyldihydropteridine diphosphokinase [Deltaproteobacteria bacterium]